MKNFLILTLFVFALFIVWCADAVTVPFSAFNSNEFNVSVPNNSISINTTLFPTNAPAVFDTNYNEIWITPVGTNDGGGNGTLQNPYISTTAVSFDGLLLKGVLPQSTWAGSTPPTNSLIPINTTIHLSAGLFHDTNGIIMQTGWRIVGAGRTQTTILRDPCTNDYNNDVIGAQSDFLPCGRSNMVVENLTIDLNRQNELMPSLCAAILLTGDNALIKNCRVVNMGLAITNSEGPAMISVSTYGGNFYGTVESNLNHNAIIDGCSLGNMAPMFNAPGAGLDGFAIGGFGFYGNTSNSSSINLDPGTFAITNGWMVGSEIKNCYLEYAITNQPTANGGFAMPAYFHAIGGFNTFSANPKIHDNYIANIYQGNSADSTAIYGEQGPNIGVQIYNNVLWNVGNGIEDATAAYYKNYVNIHDNIIRYNGFYQSMGIALSGSNPGLTNWFNYLTIRNNDVATLNGNPTNQQTEALIVNYATNVLVQGNIFNNVGSPDVLWYTNNSAFSWFNNKNGYGTNPVFNVSLPSLGYTNLPNQLVADQVVASLYGNGGGVSNVPAILTVVYTNAGPTPLYITNGNNAIAVFINTNLNGGNAALATNVAPGIILTNASFVGANGAGITNISQSSITAPYQAGPIYIEEDVPLAQFSVTTGNAPVGAGQTPTPYFTQPYLTAFTPPTTVGKYYLEIPQWVTNIVLRAQYEYPGGTNLFWTNSLLNQINIPNVGRINNTTASVTFTLATNGYTYVFFTNSIQSTIGTNCVKEIESFPAIFATVPTNIANQVSITGVHVWYKGYYDGSNW